jgi:hypothetical protein
VYRLLEEGLAPDTLAERLGGGAAGAWQYRRMVRALLDGSLPTAPTIALAAARRYRTVLKTPTLSADTRAYLQANLDELERRANDPTRLDEEAQLASEQTQQAEARNEVGVYVYALPHCIRHPYDHASGRTLLKVGCSDRDVIMRFRSQTRTTALRKNPYSFGSAGPAKTRRHPPRRPSTASWTPPTTAARSAKAPGESGSSPTPGSSTRSQGRSASTSTSSTKPSSTTPDSQPCAPHANRGIQTSRRARKPRKETWTLTAGD